MRERVRRGEGQRKGLRERAKWRKEDRERGRVTETVRDKERDR